MEKRRTLNLLDSRSPSLGPNSLALPPTHHRASTSRAAPSQPIVIYSDDEMEEVKLVPHGYMANGERRAAKAGNGEVGGLDMGARDAIKVALAKLDAEVRKASSPSASSAEILVDQIGCCSARATSSASHLPYRRASSSRDPTHLDDETPTQRDAHSWSFDFKEVVQPDRLPIQHLPMVQRYHLHPQIHIPPPVLSTLSRRRHQRRHG